MVDLLGARVLLSIGLCALSSGCIAPIRTQIAQRFSSEFACQSVITPTTMWPDGVRVEGCGQVAFYVCGSQSQSCRLDYARAMTDQERTAAAGREHAELERVRAAAPPVLKPERAVEDRRTLDADFAAARQVVVAQPDQLRPLTTVASDDWRLEVLALPAPTEFVLWRFHGERALSAPPCRPTISRDGKLIPTETIASHAPHEADFLIAKADYLSLGPAKHIRGVICGTSLDLDEAAHQKLVPATVTASP